MASLRIGRLVGGNADQFKIRRFKDRGLKTTKHASGNALGFDIRRCRMASLEIKRLVGGKTGRFEIRRFEDGSLKAKKIAGGYHDCRKIDGAGSLETMRLVGGKAGRFEIRRWRCVHTAILVAAKKAKKRATKKFLFDSILFSTPTFVARSRLVACENRQ
jgi:hypothetical protein